MNSLFFARNRLFKVISKLFYFECEGYPVVCVGNDEAVMGGTDTVHWEDMLPANQFLKIPFSREHGESGDYGHP